MVDVDGVLVTGRVGDGLPAFTDLERDLGLPLATLQAEFFARHWEAIVVGHEPLTERLAEVLARIAPSLAAEHLIAYWFEKDARIDDNVVAAIAEFRRQGTRIFLATNQEHLRAAYLMDMLGFGKIADDIIYSAALGHRKPAAEFFRLTAERAGAAPRDIVFVDDVLDNVEAARAAGWTAIRWTGGDFRALIEPLLRS
jgi:putative hydrolase of the HAD superfamily